MDKVKVAYSDVPGDVAVQLLAAAERLELDPGVVETTSDGVFVVPAKVAKEADLDTVDDDDSAEEEPVTVEGEDGQQVEIPDDIAALKGKGLEEALKSAQLDTSGRADEKRARLAAHRAGTTDVTTDDETTDDSDDDSTDETSGE